MLTKILGNNLSLSHDKSDNGNPRFGSNGRKRLMGLVYKTIIFIY